MSKADILAELPNLKSEERREIWMRLGEMEGFLDDAGEEDTLNADERALIEARLVEHERNPDSAVSWKEFETRLNRRLSAGYRVNMKLMETAGNSK